MQKTKLSISLDQQSEILNSLFLLSVQVKVYQNILKLQCWLLDFILYKMKNKKKNQKTKRTLLPASQPHFQYDFWSKIFIAFCFINCPNFITWLPLLLETLCNMFIVVNCCPDCDVIYFEIKLLIKPFIFIIKKSLQKCEYLQNEKSF